MQDKFNIAATIEADRLASVPPRPFDVDVSKLEAGYAMAVRRAASGGLLDSCTWSGRLWVCASDLADVAGPGSDTLDLHGGCHIPDDARIDHEEIDRRRADFRQAHPHLIC